MPTINRYTNIQPARYNPMSLQELMIAPQMKRQQHDKLLENIATTETALAQIDPLEIHSPLVQREQQRLYDQLEDLSGQLARQGVSPASKSDFLRLNKAYQQFLSPTGTGGKALRAKQDFEKYRDTYLKNAIEQGYSPDKALDNWQQHAADYAAKSEGTDNIRSIDPLFAPTYKNVVDETRKFAKEAGLSESDVSDLSSNIKLDEGTGQYVVNTGSRTVNANNIKQLKSVVDFMNNQILNPNSEIGRSIAHQGLSPQDALAQVAGVTPIYLKNRNVQETKNQITNFKSLIDTNNKQRSEGNLSYTDVPVETIKLDKLELSDKVSKTLNTKLTSYSGYAGAQVTGGTFSQREFKSPQEVSVLLNKELNEKEKAQYDLLAKGLRQTGVIPEDIENYSEEELAYVRDYINISEEEVSINNRLITSDVFTEYGKSTGTDKTPIQKKIGESVYLTADKRRYYDPISKEVLNYEDLDDEVKANLDKAQGAGYYGPRSFWTAMIDSDDKDLFMAPVEIKIPTDEGPKTLLVSRLSSEMNTPTYKADKKFNEIFTNSAINPFIPKEYDIQGNKVSIAKITPPTKKLAQENQQEYTRRYTIYENAVKEAFNNVYQALKLQNPSTPDEQIKRMALQYIDRDEIYVSNDAGEVGDVDSEPMYITGKLLQNQLREMYE